MGDLFQLPENHEEMLKYKQVQFKDPLLQDGPYLADNNDKYLGNMYFEDDVPSHQPDMDVKQGDTIRIRVPRIKGAEGAHKRKLKNETYIDANEENIGPAEERRVDKYDKREIEAVYLGSNFGLKLFPKEPHKNLVMENWPSEDVEVIEKTGHQSPEEYNEKWRVARLAYGADYVYGDKDLDQVDEEEKTIPEKGYKRIMRRDIEIDGEEGRMIYHITDNSETLSSMDKSFFYGLPFGPDHKFGAKDTGKIMKAISESLEEHDVDSIEVKGDESSLAPYRISNEETPGYGVAQRVGSYLLTEEGDNSMKRENAKILNFM